MRKILIYQINLFIGFLKKIILKLKGKSITICGNCYHDWGNDKHKCKYGNDVYACKCEIYLIDGWVKSKDGYWSKCSS